MCNWLFILHEYATSMQDNVRYKWAQNNAFIKHRCLQKTKHSWIRCSVDFHLLFTAQTLEKRLICIAKCFNYHVLLLIKRELWKYRHGKSGLAPPRFFCIEGRHELRLTQTNDLFVSFHEYGMGLKWQTWLRRDHADRYLGNCNRSSLISSIQVSQKKRNPHKLIMYA